MPRSGFGVYWLLLSVVFLGAGALFQHVDSVPPLLRASWRLQLTSIVLSPFFVYQWIQQEPKFRQKMFEKKILY